MHAIVERRTLFWPFNTSDGGVNLAIPGAGFGAQGGSMVTSSDDASALASYRQPFEICAQRIDFPSDVIAIAIAPDSAIECCDIAFGGRVDEISRHRVSPGNPAMGCRGDTHALISIPTPIPFVGWSESRAVPADAVIQANQLIGWPLRLELYRACDPAFVNRSKARAKLVARSQFELANTETTSLIACVDGRRRIDVIAVCPTNGDGTLTIESVETAGPDSPGSTIEDQTTLTLEVDDAGNTSVALAAGTPTVLSFDGNPMKILIVTIEATGDCDGSIQIIAWDD